MIDAVEIPLVEPPAEDKPGKKLFNSANAAEMGRKSAEARRLKREEEKRAEEERKRQAAYDSLSPLQKQIQRLEKLIREIEEQTEGCTDGAKLRDLSTAHSRYFDAWCTLTGTPKPGVRKVGKNAGRSPQPIAQPYEPPTPQPIDFTAPVVSPQAQDSSGSKPLAA